MSGLARPIPNSRARSQMAVFVLGVLAPDRRKSAPRSLRSSVLLTANVGRRRTEMGIAQYDPTALGRPAWNAGRKVGVKKPLKQIWAIRFFLTLRDA